MKYIAADHQGFELKEKIKEKYPELKDLGPFEYDKDDDYPDYVKKLCKKIGKDDLGILICSTGIGMSIAANKYRGIRAALCCSTEAARQAREHNNANVLCLSKDADLEIIKVFLNSKFSGEERHVRRIKKLND